MSDNKKVTLGQYKGLKIVTLAATANEMEIDSFIQQVMEQATTTQVILDRPVENGDVISLNFAGFCDGVQFEGGTAEDYELEIGSGSFIDGFEEQLVGAEIGKEINVNVTFPENYGAPNLAGKPAVFVCKVNAIRETIVPELNDEFCRENLTCNTVAELRELAEKQIIEQKMKSAVDKQVQILLRIIVDDSECDIPEAPVQDEIDNQINAFANTLMQQGMSFDQYCKMTGMDREKLEAQLRPVALRQVKTQVVLNAIAEAEGITITNEDILAHLNNFASQYGMDAQELMNSLGTVELENLKKDMLLNKAIDVIVENSVTEYEE